MSDQAEPDSTKSVAQKPICTVCYEDLNPVTEHLQCIPACGHVFHELCLQQWLEYCASGKKPTCPVCKQPCGAAHAPTRLYFQSTGSSSDEVLHLPSSDADSKKLSEEVTKLSCKVKNLTAAIEAQKNISNKLREEVEISKKLAEIEKATAEQTKREKQNILQLLNIKTEEISRKTMECTKLQERSLALAKELAALKLATDMNLEEDEIVKFASLGNSNDPRNALDILKRSLALRNKSYKELMAQCNILGRSETRAQQKLEKAKEQIKKLKARLLEMEKESEERENGVLRDLKITNKKMKIDEKFENSRKEDLIETIDLENDNSFMDMDEFLGSKHKLFNNCTAAYSNGTPPVYSKTGEEKKGNFVDGSIWEKGISLIDETDNQLNPNQVHDINYRTDNLGFSNGIVGNGVAKKSVSKWCKTESIKNNKGNGDLISIGADGRGGRIKVLRSLNRFNDVKAKAPKKIGVGGAKGGQSQIEQFFGKR